MLGPPYQLAPATRNGLKAIPPSLALEASPELGELGVKAEAPPVAASATEMPTVAQSAKAISETARRRLIRRRFPALGAPAASWFRPRRSLIGRILFPSACGVSCRARAERAALRGTRRDSPQLIGSPAPRFM